MIQYSMPQKASTAAELGGTVNCWARFMLADKSEGSVVGAKRCEPPGGCLLLELDAVGYCVDTPEALP